MLPPSQSSTISSPSSASRHSRDPAPESKPFLRDHSLDISPDVSASDLESDLENGFVSQSATRFGQEEKHLGGSSHPRHAFSRWRIPFLRRLLKRSRRLSIGAIETSRRPSLLRRILRLAGILLMILGFLNLVTVIIGIGLNFFPDEDSLAQHDDSSTIADDLRHWPTDSTADIHPIACHSHNDYWRKEPLFSAVSVGCTGVEADVWLFNDDLYVGHSAASLTKNRTLRSLYINPLLDLLDKQNPETELHPVLDKPRNGIFDTDAEQSLILLIDFKTDGEMLWSHVSEQLEPLRQKHYLTHFNGTDVVEGPVTIVVTGNAPWNRVIADAKYRDMFFDAPLDLMANIDSSSTSTSEAEITDLSHLSANPNGTNSHFSVPTSPASSASTSRAEDAGQGRSGAAPLNPTIYSPTNSYYASVSFKHAILNNLPLPWQYPFRSTLTSSQLDLIRAQIRGAHARGLKVRYWGVPDWPRGLREYLWRVLVREGVDYLNVDDLQAAKSGRWAGRWEDGVGGWWDRTASGRRGGRHPANGRHSSGGHKRAGGRRWWRHET